jgi:hypothetical protein
MFPFEPYRVHGVVVVVAFIQTHAFGRRRPWRGLRILGRTVDHELSFTLQPRHGAMVGQGQQELQKLEKKDVFITQKN